MEKRLTDNMADVQLLRPETPLGIDRVGVRGLKRQIWLKDRVNGRQLCLATVDLGVDLRPDFKGTHMSRLVEALDQWNEELDFSSVAQLLRRLQKSLSAEKAWARFCFSYLLRKNAPAGGGSAIMAYECSITSELSTAGQTFLLGLEVPVMTVCPCSKAISREGAHSQRALVRMKVRISRFVWLEEFIIMAENSASSGVYPLLKRVDEKFVTESAFSKPLFVEDVARALAWALSRHPDVLWHEVEVESMESIHNHNAFAYISSK